MFGSPDSVTAADWAYIMDTNVKGTFFASVHAAELMKVSGGGSIINVSSCAATVMVPDHAVYTTSKAAPEGMTRQSAFEYAPYVRVNAIAPGPTLVARNPEYDPAFEVTWGRAIPMGRVADPMLDLVGPVVFLASDQSRYITGDVLHPDGGWTLKGATPGMTDMNYESDRHRG